MMTPIERIIAGLIPDSPLVNRAEKAAWRYRRAQTVVQALKDAGYEIKLKGSENRLRGELKLEGGCTPGWEKESG